MSKLKSKLTVWLLALLCSLILQNCASFRSLKSGSQRRDTTIVFNAQKISDAEAAVACYDMLINCEKQLADSTLALKKTREGIPEIKKNATKKGAIAGSLGTLSLLGLLALFVK